MRPRVRERPPARLRRAFLCPRADQGRRGLSAKSRAKSRAPLRSATAALLAARRRANASTRAAASPSGASGEVMRSVARKSGGAQQQRRLAFGRHDPRCRQPLSDASPRDAERRRRVDFGAKPRSAGCDADADRTGDAGAAEPAISAGIFRQILLVIAFGEIERPRLRDLGGDRAEPLRLSAPGRSVRRIAAPPRAAPRSVA